MKKLFLTGFAAITTFIGGPAMSADLPTKAPAPVLARPACAQFGGFYLGGHAGFGWQRSTYEDTNGYGQTVDTGLPRSAVVTDENFLAGVQGGYNWQQNCKVVGFEADWSWSNLKASNTFTDGDPTAIDTINLESRLRWFGTARVRGGVVVDNILVYVTGGLAYAKFDRSVSFNQDSPLASAVFTSDKVRWGWTVGAGAEWQWANNWSLKGEFLYMNFQDSDYPIPVVTINGATFGNPGSAYSIKNQDEVWVARLGVNYRF